MGLKESGWEEGGLIGCINWCVGCFDGGGFKGRIERGYLFNSEKKNRIVFRWFVLI